MWEELLAGGNGQCFFSQSHFECEAFTCTLGLPFLGHTLDCAPHTPSSSLFVEGFAMLFLPFPLELHGVSLSLGSGDVELDFESYVPLDPFLGACRPTSSANEGRVSVHVS